MTNEKCKCKWGQYYSENEHGQSVWVCDECGAVRDKPKEQEFTCAECNKEIHGRINLVDPGSYGFVRFKNEPHEEICDECWDRRVNNQGDRYYLNSEAAY